MNENREEFQRDLERIEAKVIELFAMVAEDLPKATQALLNGDNDVLAHVHCGVPSGRAVDVLDDAAFGIERGSLEVRMTPRTVRMLALE